MNGEQRRNLIIDKLKVSNMPISATSFAEEFGVTRQIVVADIALLRASGYAIRAEHKGYVLDKQDSNGLIKHVVVKHGKDNVLNELFAIIDNGGKVVDVIVDHSVYGKISAELNLASRYDATCFVEKIDQTGACPLSILTEGTHVHTILVKDQDSFERIKTQLDKMGILIESN